MLDIISYIILGVWSGYSLRRYGFSGRKPHILLRIIFIVSFVVALMYLMFLVGVSAQAISRWGAFAGLGMAYMLSARDEAFDGLRKIKPELSLIIVFSLIEGFRTWLIYGV